MQTVPDVCLKRRPTFVRSMLLWIFAFASLFLRSLIKIESSLAGVWQFTGLRASLLAGFQSTTVVQLERRNEGMMEREERKRLA